MVIFKFRDFSCRDPQEWIVGHPISRFLSHKNPKLLMGFLSKSYGSTMGMGGPWNVPLQISQFQVPVLCFRGLAARKSRLFKSKMVHEVPFPFKKLRHYLFCCYSNQIPLPVLGPFGWIPLWNFQVMGENLSPGAYHSAKELNETWWSQFLPIMTIR